MIYEKTDNFFIQKINMTNIEQGRFEFLEEICKNKKVLHIGCADTGTFNAEYNLHLSLSKITNHLHGMDINEDGLNKLIEICPGQYFTNINDCDQQYDIVLVPEVLEHVWNIKECLDQIFGVKSKEYLISVPNIIHYSKEMIQEDGYAMEIVNPDHKYWFSPYTLYNIVKQYIKNEDKCTMYYLESKSMVAIHIKEEGEL